jgi:hypothetical protein
VSPNKPTIDLRAEEEPVLLVKQIEEEAIFPAEGELFLPVETDSKAKEEPILQVEHVEDETVHPVKEEADLQVVAIESNEPVPSVEDGSKAKESAYEVEHLVDGKEPVIVVDCIEAEESAAFQVESVDVSGAKLESQVETVESVVAVSGAKTEPDVESIKSVEDEEHNGECAKELQTVTDLEQRDLQVEPVKEEDPIAFDVVETQPTGDDENDHEKTPVNEEETPKINQQRCRLEQNGNVTEKEDVIISNFKHEEITNDESVKFDAKGDVSALLQNDISGEILESPEDKNFVANSQSENIQNSEILEQIQEKKVSSDTSSLVVESSAIEEHSAEDVCQSETSSQNVEEAHGDDKTILLEKEESLVIENSSTVVKETAGVVEESETRKESEVFDHESKPTQPPGSTEPPPPPPPPPPGYLPCLQLAPKKVDRKVTDGAKRMSTAEQVQNPF